MTAKEIEAGFARGDALMASVNIQPKPRQHMPAPAAAPAKARFPYMDTRLNIDIRDEREEKIVAEVLAMDYEGLLKLDAEFQLASNLNYPCMKEHWHSVKVRAAFYRMTILKSEGKLEPAPTVGDFVRGWVRGWLIGDEFAKRHGW